MCSSDLASTGLTLVDAPSSSSDEPEEERLLRKLLSLYRARQAKLESREALVARAAVDIEKHARSSGVSGRKLSGLWQRSGSKSPRSGKPSSSRRLKLKSNSGLLPRSYMRRKASWRSARSTLTATRRSLPRASKHLAGEIEKRAEELRGLRQEAL